MDVIMSKQNARTNPQIQLTNLEKCEGMSNSIGLMVQPLTKSDLDPVYASLNIFTISMFIS
jgi:hypothetical protein